MTSEPTDQICEEGALNRLTREALADVDAGSVIDHRIVHEWANSLNTEAPLPVPLTQEESLVVLSDSCGQPGKGSKKQNVSEPFEFSAC